MLAVIIGLMANEEQDSRRRTLLKLPEGTFSSLARQNGMTRNGEIEGYFSPLRAVVGEPIFRDILGDEPFIKVTKESEFLDYGVGMRAFCVYKTTAGEVRGFQGYVTEDDLLVLFQAMTFDFDKRTFTIENLHWSGDESRLKESFDEMATVIREASSDNP